MISVLGIDADGRLVMEDDLRVRLLLLLVADGMVVTRRRSLGLRTSVETSKVSQVLKVPAPMQGVKSVMNGEARACGVLARRLRIAEGFGCIFGVSDISSVPLLSKQTPSCHSVLIT